MARLILRDANGLTKPPNVNIIKAAQHLIGHFNIGHTADNENAGKVVYVDGNYKGHAVAGAEKVGWDRSDDLVSMRIDRQGYHTQPDPEKPQRQYRMCRYAIQLGGATYASINAQINITFGKRMMRRALNESLLSEGVSQVFLMT